MNNYKYSISSAQKLTDRFKTTDPFELAELLDIEIHKIGNVEKFLGLFTVINGHKVIIVNDNMPSPLMNFVLMHEIAHSILHIDLIENGLLEADCSENFSPSIRQVSENEANVFAAEILINSNELDNALKYTKQVNHIAFLLDTIPEAVILKCKAHGKLCYETHSDFLCMYNAPQNDNYA